MESRKFDEGLATPIPKNGPLMFKNTQGRKMVQYSLFFQKPGSAPSTQLVAHKCLCFNSRSSDTFFWPP